MSVYSGQKVEVNYNVLQEESLLKYAMLDVFFF